MATSEKRPEAPAGTGASRGHQRDLVRAAILDAAGRLLEQGGVPALTMRAIARQIGVSAPTIYSHFRNKEAVVDQLAAQGFQRLAVTLRAARDGTGGSRLAAVATAYGRFATESGALFELMFPVTVAAAPPAGPAVAEEFRLALAGEQSPDRALAAWAIVHGLIALERSGLWPAGPDRERAITALLHDLLERGEMAESGAKTQ